MNANPTLLLIEDDQELLDLLARRFQKQGIDVAPCSDAQQAFSAIVECPQLKVAIVDGLLQGADGAHLLTQLRQHKPALRFIMFSGNASPEAVARARQLGADAYLCKPCSFAELLAAAEHSLAQADLADHPIQHAQ
jgi:DNA-binding response OmpR family regulator